MDVFAFMGGDTGLNYLVVGDFLVWKRPAASNLLRHFRLWLAPCTRLIASRVYTGSGGDADGADGENY